MAINDLKPMTSFGIFRLPLKRQQILYMPENVFNDFINRTSVFNMILFLPARLHSLLVLDNDRFVLGRFSKWDLLVKKDWLVWSYLKTYLIRSLHLDALILRNVFQIKISFWIAVWTDCSNQLIWIHSVYFSGRLALSVIMG